MIFGRKFRTKKAKKREQIRITIKTILFLVSFFVLASIVVYATRLKQLRIKNFNIDTQTASVKDGVAMLVDTELNKMYIGLFPKNSIFITSYKKLEEKIRDSFPKILNIKIQRSGLYTINAEIKEREPKALWCGDVVPPVAQKRNGDLQKIKNEWGTCYFMDKDGYIYAKAPFFTGNIFPHYYGSLEHAEPIAQQYIPKNEFRKWQNFYTSFSYDDITPQALLFSDEEDAEVYLTNGVTIYLPRNKDINMIKNRILAIIEAGKMEDPENIEYIDLRFGKKAFIKHTSGKSEN